MELYKRLSFIVALLKNILLPKPKVAASEQHLRAAFHRICVSKSCYYNEMQNNSLIRSVKDHNILPSAHRG